MKVMTWYKWALIGLSYHVKIFQEKRSLLKSSLNKLISLSLAGFSHWSDHQPAG